MKVSELILELTALEQTHGDVEVHVRHAAQSNGKIEGVDAKSARRGATFIVIEVT